MPRASKPKPRLPGWTDPVFRFDAGAGAGGSDSGSGGLPWWVAPSSPGSGPGGSSGPTAPIDAPIYGGSTDYGRDGSRPDEGPDTMFTGGNPYGGRSPYATDVNAQTMGRLLGLFGVPSSVGTRGMQGYADRYGDDNPYDTATPGNTGPVYYGPVRHPGVGGDFEYGDQYADDWAQESRNWWNGANPNIGLGGEGFGGSGSGFAGGVGGGGGADPYAGTASQYWWGGASLY